MAGVKSKCSKLPYESEETFSNMTQENTKNKEFVFIGDPCADNILHKGLLSKCREEFPA